MCQPSVCCFYFVFPQEEEEDKENVCVGSEMCFWIKTEKKLYELDISCYVYNLHFHHSPAFSFIKTGHRNLTAKNERLNLDFQSNKLKFYLGKISNKIVLNSYSIS